MIESTTDEVVVASVLYVLFFFHEEYVQDNVRWNHRIKYWWCCSCEDVVVIAINGVAVGCSDISQDINALKWNDWIIHWWSYGCCNCYCYSLPMTR